MDALRGLGISLLAFGSLVPLATGCGGDEGSADNQRPSGGNGGSGAQNSGGTGNVINVGGANQDGGGGSGGVDPLTGCGSNLTGTARDFRADHPDFECTKMGYTDPYNKNCGPWDPEIVGALGSLIGPDRKPVYAGAAKTTSTTGKANFDQWYNTVTGVNEAGAVRLDLTKTMSGSYAYQTNRFFPIDDQLLAAGANDPDKGKYIDDDGKARNFHFTYELHTTFKYQPVNVFQFRGDDDVFVYVNDTLVVNLGGVHVELLGTIDLDSGRVEVTAPNGFPQGVPGITQMASLGYTESISGGAAGTVALNLVPDQVYKLDFFFAERNCCGSNFRIETNLVFINCGSMVE